MPTVSVIVPMYNVEMYLDRCIKSIIGQSYKDIEIICVNDGSLDKSGDIAESYARIDSRIKVIHKENAGLGMARNTGIEYANGKFVVFVDSDDYLNETIIYDLVKCAQCNHADTVIAAYSRKKGDKIDIIPNVIADRIFRNEEIIPNILEKMLGPLSDGTDIINMAAWRVLYSLEIIKNYNLLYPSEREFISEDIIFDIKYYVYAKCVCGIANAGYIYCMNPGSLTEKYNAERYEKGKILYFEKWRLLEERGILSENAKYRIEESYLRYSRYAIKSECKFAKKNGKQKAKDNISRICMCDDLKTVIRMHVNNNKSIIDKLIDYCVIHNYTEMLYKILWFGYKLKGK